MILLMILLLLVAATSLTIILTIQSETSIRYRCPNYIPHISSQIVSPINDTITQDLNEHIVFDSKITKYTKKNNVFKYYQNNNQTKEITTNTFSIYNNSIVLVDSKDIQVWSLENNCVIKNPTNLPGFGCCVCVSDGFVFVGYEQIWNRIAVFNKCKTEYKFSQFLLFHNEFPFDMKCNDKYLVAVSMCSVTIFKITKNEMFIPFQIMREKYCNSSSQMNIREYIPTISDIHYDKITQSSHIHVKYENEFTEYSW